MRDRTESIKPMLVLLAGPTCSGKSSVARAVQILLSPGACEIVALDRYYRDLSHLDPNERAAANFDHPDAMDWPLVRESVDRLCRGKPAQAPTYDFTRHTRCAKTVEIPCAPVLIVEGVLAHWDVDLAKRAGLRVFLDIPDDVALARRIERDVLERGRSAQCVRAQFYATVQPMADCFLKPAKCGADIVLDGREPIRTLAETILDRIPAV